MLRVGLTGELGSGKSTVARLLAACGARVLSSDEMARALMEPGEAVYSAIVDRFGCGVVDGSGRLNRVELARVAFDPCKPRVEELNALVHPAVLAEQERQIRALGCEHPDCIVVIESALIFSVTITSSIPGTHATKTEAEHWKTRFDCIVVVTASRATKIARFLERAAGQAELQEGERERLIADATRRLDLQAQTPVPEDASILLLPNDGDLPELETRTRTLWAELTRRAQEAARSL